jgi:hypothetical protein
MDICGFLSYSGNDGGHGTMGKKTYFVNGSYYIIDDETGNIKKLVVQDDSNIPVDDLKQLIRMLATEVEKNDR